MIATPPGIDPAIFASLQVPSEFVSVRRNDFEHMVRGNRILKALATNPSPSNAKAAKDWAERDQKAIDELLGGGE